MKRRNFLKQSAIATAGMLVAPYILPSGRLFAATGNRIANHVIYVLFAGGIRNQESVYKSYLSAQNGFSASGNLMENMISGAAPTSNLLYNRWQPILTNPISAQGVLFPEMEYKMGPTGHFNGHTTAITGNYTSTGLNLNINPDMPTIFEYYRKHTTPNKSALNSWWISEGLGPYPSLNYSRHADYGATYGANYLNPSTIFQSYGQQYLAAAKNYQPDDVNRMEAMKSFLNNSFNQQASALPGIKNDFNDKQQIKSFISNLITKTQNNQIQWPLPASATTNDLSGDLTNIAYGWEVMNTFKPELMVINTFNLDVCHSDFTGYLQFLHKADYGIGWLWNKIQSTPGLMNDTVLICMPEHSRNLQPNAIYDANGLRAFDHTSDQNSRRMFGLIVGPSGKVKQNVTFGSQSTPVGESIDMAPTIAHILGFENDIPAGLLPGRVLTEAFV
jgi:hypothetical protein